MRWQKLLIIAVIAFHAVTIPVWSTSCKTPLCSRINTWVSKYFLFFGLWQSWDMFSPDPLSTNIAIDAVFSFDDGSIDSFGLFPMLKRRSLWDRYVNERYRKWAIDRVRTDDYSKSWPDAARYFAREYYKREGRKPKKVNLIRNWIPVTKPLLQNYQPLPENVTYSNSYEFFEYDTSDEDFK